MCLTINKSSKKQKATKNIKVWKVVLRGTTSEFISPYKEDPINVPGSQKAKLLRKSEPIYDIITEGIHIFTDRNMAIRDLAWWENGFILEGYIPKGEYFYRGAISDSKKMAAATKVIYTKKIMSYEDIDFKKI